MTAILAKIGIEGVLSHLATAIRTIVVLALGVTQCELWTDNYPEGHRQDMADSRYEYEAEMPMAAEGKAAYN